MRNFTKNIFKQIFFSVIQKICLNQIKNSSLFTIPAKSKKKEFKILDNSDLNYFKIIIPIEYILTKSL